MVRYLAILALGLLTACGSVYRDTDVPMMAQADFDAARYLGTWYEIARFPVPFQKGCTATTATYGPLDADTITVLNRCRAGSPDGDIREISGTADLVAPGKLSVKFSGIPLIKGAYWVLWVDDAYQTAVVGVPNGRAGWVLARRPQISAETRARAEAVLRRNGYNPLALIDVPHGDT